MRNEWTRCCWLFCVAGLWVSAFLAAAPGTLDARFAGKGRADLPLYQKQYGDLHKAFVGKLEDVARFCEEKNLPLDAAEVREFARPYDARRLRADPLPRNVQPELAAGLPPDERFWRAQLRKHREEYARDLYLLARKVLGAGYISFAFDLIREVAVQDPDHAPARKLLGYVRMGEEWVTPFAAQMLRKKYAWHDTYGWLPKDHIPRYENGDRYFQGKWIGAAKEASLRQDFSLAWEVRTEHYLIKTNHSLERGVELARELEDYYRTFFQTFAGFFTSRDELKQLFDGTNSRAVQGRPFEIHYYRDRDEYNRRLRGKIQQPIDITTGLYLSRDRVAYFFHDPAAEPESRTTLFHEATHQLFSETRVSQVPVGMRANFWIIEGIACYMESFRREGEDFTLGYPSYIRFKAAQYRYVTDKYYVPFQTFSRMGMNEFQSDEQISKNYSQAAGLAHFFMHAENGAYREALIEHLSDIYSLKPRVRDLPRTLESLTGVDAVQLDEEYGSYISALGSAPAPAAAAE